MSEYRKGFTPDINILFHKHVTLGGAADYCFRFIGADAVATGHYVRTVPGERNPLLPGLQGTLCGYDLTGLHFQNAYTSLGTFCHNAQCIHQRSTVACLWTMHFS